MASDAEIGEKLQGFLRELKPDARALLMAELERGLLRGDDMPGADLILRELRSTLREGMRMPERIGNASRLFFVPLEPFFVDDAPDYLHEGRLARASVNPLWDWICRDLAPAEANAYADQAARLLLANDQTGAAHAAHAFQDRVAHHIETALAVVRTDDKARRRLAHHIGTPRAIEDAHRLASILKSRDVLAGLAGRLPSHIRNFTDNQVNSIKEFLDSTAGRQRDVFISGLVLVMSALSAPWQLIRLATKAAQSDVAARIAETPYAVAVTMVLAEVERLVRELRADLKRGQAMARPMLLKDIHDAARGLRTEMDLSGDSPWGRRLAHIRADIAAILRSEIESLPGRVRRLLRPRPAREITAGSTVDAGDVADTEALIDFVSLCRNYAGELAINEMTLRAHSEVRQYLEASTQALLDGLRMAGKHDRNYRQSQIDAAVRFCAKIFGQEYAGLLAKAAEVAAASKRKAAAKA